MSSSIPTGVIAVAMVFFLAGAYLCMIGAFMLVSPGAVSMALGAPLLNGLELAGPYIFLLTAGVGALIGWGLLRLLWGGLGIIVRVMIVWYLYQEPVAERFSH
jgi:hypothetical protein